MFLFLGGFYYWNHFQIDSNYDFLCLSKIHFPTNFLLFSFFANQVLFFSSEFVCCQIEILIIRSLVSQEILLRLIS